MDLDIVLQGTGFSSKTKALRMYSRHGVKSTVTQRSFDACMVLFDKFEIILKDGTVLEDGDILPMAMALANREMNGSFPRGFEVDGYYHNRNPFRWDKTVDYDMLLMVVGSLKLITIERWRKAIQLIDDEI